MDRPDSRIFASYPMPAKIDLLNERPRRESQIERQLADQIGQQISPAVPRIMVSSEQQNFTNTITRSASPMIQQQQQQQQQHQSWSSNDNTTQEMESVRSLGGSRSPGGRTEIKETRIIINQHSTPSIVSSTSHFEGPHSDSEHTANRRSVSPQPRAPSSQQQQQFTPQPQQQQYYGVGGPQSSNQQQRTTTTVTTTTTTNQQQQQKQQQQQQQQQKNQQEQPEVRQASLNQALNRTISNNAAMLALELAEKEAKLMKEITALHQRPYSPYQTPAKIDLTNESRAAQVQQSHVPAPSPQMALNSRPNSRASNRSQTSQMDLMEKEAKLLKEIEEIEAKPYNPQTMLVEREQWYEYPPGARPSERHLTESTRRVRDFCSLPRNLCQDRHVHEENLPARGRTPVTPTPGSIHTTIIRSPKREIDNKSPLPFAFDNFTTKGVRGNIASANAVEPDRPRPPIFPIVKRSPSPNVAH